MPLNQFIAIDIPQTVTDNVLAIPNPNLERLKPNFVSLTPALNKPQNLGNNY